MFITNAWYVAALTNEITDGLFARRVVDIPMVLYRTEATGELTALEDRCPHRQVPLSKGRRDGDEIECWYHGLRFDQTGTCVHIPSQDAIPQTARTRSFPVVERYGFVWVWPGDPARAESTPIPDHSVCEAPGVVGTLTYEHGNADYRFGIDNFLDSSHVAFLHPGTVMSEAVSNARPEVRIEDNKVLVRRVLRMEKSPPLFELMMGLDHIDRIQDLVFWPVGNTRVETTAHPPGDPDGPALRTWTIGIFTPETATTAHVFTGIFRDFELDNEDVQKVSEEQLDVIMHQDIDVVEHAQANWDDSVQIVQLSADQGANAARRILKRLLDEEALSRR